MAKYWIVPNGNPNSEDRHVKLCKLDIDIFLLEAKDFKKAKISVELFESIKCIHNHRLGVNAKTGVRFPSGRVGWAFKHGVLIIIDREIVISPDYLDGGKYELHEV
jgi:hypothetical protein